MLTNANMWSSAKQGKAEADGTVIYSIWSKMGSKIGTHYFNTSTVLYNIQSMHSMYHNCCYGYAYLISNYIVFIYIVSFAVLWLLEKTITFFFSLPAI